MRATWARIFLQKPGHFFNSCNGYWPAQVSTVRSVGAEFLAHTAHLASNLGYNSAHIIFMYGSCCSCALTHCFMGLVTSARKFCNRHERDCPVATTISELTTYTWSEWILRTTDSTIDAVIFGNYRDFWSFRRKPYFTH